ncbi:MAG TPA: hypothetical protein VIS49_08605 [Cyclobacteriaceae bacterium]
MNTVHKYEIRAHLYYDPEHHFWLDVNGKSAVIGLSPLIQETSGSFVAVQFADQGFSFRQHERIGTVEAEKHVGALKAPVSGRIITTNEALLENPRLINDRPYDEGWLMEIEMTDASELDNLVAGKEHIEAWFKSELKKFNDKGWIAQP